MRATELLHNLGQSIWLDNITRDLLNMSVTELTSNPTIFGHAIKNSTAFDTPIREKLAMSRNIQNGEGMRTELEGHCGARSPRCATV